MKKDYEAPKAEKMEFNYSEMVVASSCNSGITKYYTDEGKKPDGTACDSRYVNDDGGHFGDNL